jgi:hypothetical protein
MPRARLELAHLTILAPKTSASTNSAISAKSFSQKLFEVKRQKAKVKNIICLCSIFNKSECIELPKECLGRFWILDFRFWIKLLFIKFRIFSQN